MYNARTLGLGMAGGAAATGRLGTGLLIVGLAGVLLLTVVVLLRAALVDLKNAKGLR